MAIARFKDLCIDAVDPDVLAGFWGPALGLRPEGTTLVGDRPEQTIWVNRVPEPRTVKQRVHLDVHGGADGLAGATPVSAAGEFRWQVLADPEGGELCLFVREEVPDYRLYELGVDAAESARIAAWWAEVLGARLGHDPQEGAHSVEGVPGLPFDGIVFVDVPEPKTVKNRIHWDLTVTHEAGVEALVERGARVLRSPDDEVSWTVLADPEGNEFCVFLP